MGVGDREVAAQLEQLAANGRRNGPLAQTLIVPSRKYLHPDKLNGGTACNPAHSKIGENGCPPPATGPP